MASGWTTRASWRFAFRSARTSVMNEKGTQWVWLVGDARGGNGEKVSFGHVSPESRLRSSINSFFLVLGTDGGVLPLASLLDALR